MSFKRYLSINDLIILLREVIVVVISTKTITALKYSLTINDPIPHCKVLAKHKKCICITDISTGLQLSHLSLGSGPFGGLYGEASEQACVDTVHLALKSGINYIDTAPWYGNGRSEEVLGKVCGILSQNMYIVTNNVGRQVWAKSSHWQSC